MEESDQQGGDPMLFGNRTDHAADGAAFSGLFRNNKSVRLEPVR